jgi:hypothetical protein
MHRFLPAMHRRLLLALTVTLLSLPSAACGAARYSSAGHAMSTPELTYLANANAGGGAAGTASTATTTVAGSTDAVATAIPEQLVIEGWLRVEVESIKDLVSGLRKQVEDAGGRMINEEVSGAETSWSATLKIRLPPEQVEPIVAWLAGRGQITDKRISATDVSRTLFDQELAIKNQSAALDRLHKLLEQGGLTMADILQIEKEMTRLRGEIEALEGSTRFLKDRVALATLDIQLSRRAGAVTIAKAKVYPGARFAALVLLDPGDRKRVRLGGGAVMHTVFRQMSIELDFFQEAYDAAGTDRSNAALATLGGAFYSDFLGGGQRQVLNPYIGFRLGYGYLDGSKFAAQAEAGIELYKHEHAAVDANVRFTGLIDDDGAAAALVLGGGATFAF